MFTEQKFQIGALTGISEKTIEEHLKLYAGYVKHANLIMTHEEELSNPPAGGSEKYAYELAEIQRRFGFEWGGIRNHEVYFSLLEGGATPINPASALYTKIIAQWSSWETFITRMKLMAMTRGVGWAMLYYDEKTDMLLPGWIDEQHLGQLADCRLIFALDMWEHSYVADYQPSGKKQYVEDFFTNVNWSVAETYFATAQGK
jgi:Fe-Mn family superoxide dismutase